MCCNTTFIRSGLTAAAAALLSLMLLAGPANAQVRAPQGNSLPDKNMQAAPMPIPTHDQRNGEQVEKPRPGAASPFMNPAAHAKPAKKLTDKQHWQFAQNIDLSHIRDLAVFSGGRIMILDTLAREKLETIYGRAHWTDATTGRTYDPVFTYLDLLFHKSYYSTKPIIDVQILELRKDLINATIPDKNKRMWWLREGRVSPVMIMQGAVKRILTMQNQDLRQSDAIAQVMQSAWAFNQIGNDLELVSPDKNSAHWHRLDQVVAASMTDTSIKTPTGVVPVPANPKASQKAMALWKQMGTAWRQADAGQFNQLAGQFASTVQKINPATYPPTWRRSLEHFYNLTDRMTIGWVIYFLATVTMLLAFMVGRKWIIRLGIGLLLGGIAIHAFSIFTRAVLAQRWPIDNQYESFIAITFFAVVAGVIIMWARRQWIFGAAAGALGTCALLMANLVNIPSGNVEQVAGILATSTVLYLHVDIVLFSYAMIALGFFISLFYLFFYYFGNDGHHPRLNKKPADDSSSFSVSGGGGGGSGASASVSPLLRFAAMGIGAKTDRAEIKEKTDSAAGSTSARAAMIGRAKLLHDLDKAQMVVLQLGFWLLGVGVLLGAYWADHAWGRWWGWDPKETWALITWIIYLIALHVRYGVKKRGLSTAWLSVLGFFVMLWTYWGVNLLIAGLHSYA